MSRLLLFSLISITLCARSLAQGGEQGTREPPPLPPAPADRILDEAGLLDDKTRVELRSHIQALESQSNVSLYLAAYTLLPEKIDVRARRLRQHWGAGDPRCVVVVYRRGSQEITFSASGDSEEFIPTGELLKIYDGAVVAARDHEDPRQRIVTAVGSLAGSLMRDLSIRDAKRGFLTREVALLIAAFSGVTLLLGGVSFLFLRHLRQRQHERDGGLSFPEVAVGRRLGAPFGGGVVAEVGFGKPAVSPPPSPDRG